MILGVLAGLLLAASEPQGAPAPTDDEVKAARETYERAQQIYHDSCQERAYGAYDDLCEQLGRQVRKYQLDLDRLEHRRPSPKAPSAPGPSATADHEAQPATIRDAGGRPT
jgi:hypothetical protein